MRFTPRRCPVTPFSSQSPGGEPETAVVVGADRVGLAPAPGSARRAGSEAIGAVPAPDPEAFPVRSALPAALDDLDTGELTALVAEAR